MASTDLPPKLSFSGNGGYYPPHGTITPNDHGAYVVVTSWIMMCLTGLSVLSRLSMRRNLGKDNIAIIIASVRPITALQTSIYLNFLATY